MIKIYNMDVMRALKQMPDESVDMQITSPPYWGLRDYGIGKDQIGLESSFEDYVKRLCNIFDEVKRVLKKDGTCWVNLGDTYGGSGCGKGDRRNNNKRPSQPMHYKDKPNPQLSCGIRPKCLCAIPERFMIEMINRGWILRNKIIWHKPNHMPTSVKDRFASSWEYLFLFSKSKKYYFDLDAVREAYKHGKGASFNLRVRDVKRGYAEKSGQYRASEKEVEQYHGQSMSYSPKGKNPDDVIQTRSDFATEAEYRAFIRKGKNYAGKNAPQNTIVGFNPKGKNPDDVMETPHHPKGDENIGMRLPPQANQPNAFHPLGKNPGDIIKLRDFSGSKFKEGERAGLQRQPTLREKRIHEVIQIKIAEFLREWTNGFEEDLDKEFGEHKWRHWIRTDLSGASLPSPEDWVTMKTMLKFPNNYDAIMTETEVYLDDGMMWKNKPKNPSDFWDITTRGYPEAHFAVFPEKLVERPIKTTPRWICKKCGKARERITKPSEEYAKLLGKSWHPHSNDKVRGQSGLGLGHRQGAIADYKTLGWTNCNCNAGFHPAVIMDIFAGSGTTLKVARDLHRDSIGIEIKKEYVDLIKKRLFGGNQPLINDFEIIK